MDKFKGFCMVLIGVALIGFLAVPQYKITTSPAQDIYEINADDIVEGTHITGQVDFVYDYYATESKEEKTLGVTTSTQNDTARWYLVPVYGPSQEESRYITLRISPKDYTTLDKIVDDTWAYLEGETDSFGQTTYSIDARAVKIDSELRQLYYDWWSASGIAQAEAEKYLAPYVLVPIMEMNIIWIVVGFSALLILIGLVFMFKRKKVARTVMTAEAPRADIYSPTAYTPETYDPDERYERNE